MRTVLCGARESAAPRSGTFFAICAAVLALNAGTRLVCAAGPQPGPQKPAAAEAMEDLDALDTEDAAEAGVAAEADDDDLPPDRKNEHLTKKAYDVRPYLRCPLGIFVEAQGQRTQIADERTDDWFLGPNTPLGGLIVTMLVEYDWQPGVNHFAPKAGVLEVTNTEKAHKDVERVLAALAAMPGLNPRGGGHGLDADRCVHVCAASLAEDAEPLESVLYDVSDLLQKMSPVEITTAIQGIDRETWIDALGGGRALYYDAARAVAVVQTSAVHEKIKNGLAQVRGITRKPPKPPKKPVRPPGAAKTKAKAKAEKAEAGK